MKNLLLSIFLGLAMSFSFAQSNSKADVKEKAYLKKNTVTAVNFLSKNLKLDSKQKAIFMNAYSEYANSIAKGQNKMKTKGGDRPSMDSKKQMQEYVLRFTEKRNKTIIPCLKKKQVKDFNEIQKRINPMTLEVRSERKK